MNPILTIAAKEFRTSFKDKVFIIIATLFVLLSIASVYIGSSTKNAEMAAYQNVVDLLTAQGSSNLPAAPDIYPLAILSNIVTYVSMIGSVVAIFLGFDTFSGERENGTLRLILTRPVFRDQLIAGKLIGGGFVLALLMTVTLVTNAVLFTVVSGIVPNANETGRLIIFTIVAFLYLMVILAVTLFISMKMRDRSYAFLIMMIVWLFISFVIPQLADTQKNFAMSLSGTGQTVTSVATDTAVSKAIEYYSPAAQFQIIGDNLLQTVTATASLSVGGVVTKQLVPTICMLLPGLVFLAVSHRTIRKEDV